MDGKWETGTVGVPFAYPDSVPDVMEPSPGARLPRRAYWSALKDSRDAQANAASAVATIAAPVAAANASGSCVVT
jgi:hypothetical protein